jgi:RNA polymerase sigma-70 factor (ECF subfamily)
MEGARVASMASPVVEPERPETTIGGARAFESKSSYNVSERQVEDREDGKAIQVFQEGDYTAFDGLVSKYRGQVYRICYRFSSNHHDADDLAQEAFLRAYRGLHKFKGQSRFSTWLYRVAVNTCLNWVSSRKTKLEPLPEHLPDPAPGQIEGLTKNERSRTVREALAHLPEKQRMTLVLRTYHGMSHREISELMGSSIGTTKANFFFALRNLRKVLEKAGLVAAE